MTLLPPLALLSCVAALAVAIACWRHRLNPIVLGVLAWAPAFVMAAFPREFLSPVYEYLNHDIDVLAFVAMFMGFVSFSLGVMMVLAVVGRRGWDRQLAAHSVQIHDHRLLILFALGLAVFIYSFARAGLGDVVNLDPEEVAESRLRLHLGPLSFVVLFIDIGAIVFLARLLETRRYVYAIPMFVAVICHMVTLHKSPTLFLVMSSVFVFLLYPKAAWEVVAGTRKRRLVLGIAIAVILVALLVMNALRGIGIIALTSFEWTWFEQFYIYSGGSAILNLSASVEGYVATPPPTLGLILAKPITWHLVDREMLNATVNLGGINAATYLIYPWSDFRWIGFVITPFLTGMVVTSFFWLALRKTIYGLMLGAIAFKAVIFSVNTDVIFDPTTLVVIVVAFIAHLLASRSRRARRRAAPAGVQRPDYRPPPPNLETKPAK